MAWVPLVMGMASLIVSFASFFFLLHLVASVKKIQRTKDDPIDLGLKEELIDQIEGLRRTVDRLNDTIHEELLQEQVSLGTITHDN